MSSLQENSSVPLDVVNKRKTPFSRSDSFDKFQYTAFYSIQLAGELLSHKSLLLILEDLQYKSRQLLRKLLVLTLWPKMMCGVLLFWVDAFTRYTGINVVFEKKVASSANVQPEKTYILRVQKRKPAVIAKTLSAPEMKRNDANDDKRSKLIAGFDAVHPQLRPQMSSPSLIQQWKSADSDSEMGSNNSLSSRQNIGMVVIVYGSATFVYIQLMMLAAFLQTAATPPGLIFLVLSLAYIGYIIFTMFVKTKSKEDTATSNKTTPKSTPSEPSTPPEDSVSELPARKSARLSRTSTRRFLYFHNKTLSKIKLL